MVKCKHCGKEIGLLAVRYTWLDKENKIAIHDKCIEEYKKKESGKIKQTQEEIRLNGPRICPNCGRSIPVDARICPYCKRDFEQTAQDLNEKKGKINSSIVAGIISVIFLVIEIYGIALLISERIFGFGLGDIVILVGLVYVIHKTLLKKQRLTTWEWVGFSILVIWFCVAMVYGFLIGFMEGYSSAFQ